MRKAAARTPPRRRAECRAAPPPRRRTSSCVRAEVVVFSPSDLPSRANFGRRAFARKWCRRRLSSATEQFAHAAERGARVMVTVGRGAPLGRGTRSCALARQGSVRIGRATRGGCGNPSADARLAGRRVLVDREVVGTKEASRTNIPRRPSTRTFRLGISSRSARADESSNSRRQSQLQASTIRRVDRRVRTRRRARL